MPCPAQGVDSRNAVLRDYLGGLKGAEGSESNLIAVLHRVQEIYGFLNREALDEVALAMNIPTAHIWGVATFYHYFKLSRPGRHVISICLGTACYIKGVKEIQERLREELGVDIGGVSPDGLFSLEEARCLGACGLAPVMMIDGKIFGMLTPKRVSEILQEYRKSDGKQP